MTIDLKDRIAVITGASLGIGFSCMKLFSEKGARVIVNARNKENLNSAVDSLEEYKQQLFTVYGNCAKEEILDEIFNLSEKQFKRAPDLVIVNAARGIWGTLMDSDPKEWKELLELNVFGSLLLMRKAASKMIKLREEGYSQALDIVLLGSCAGNNIPQQSSLYSASKFAVNSAAESLRRELAEKQIRVSIISPGNTKTEFRKGFNGHPDADFQKTESTLGKLIDGDDIANSIYFTVSQEPHVHIHDIRIRTTTQTYP